MNKSYDHIIAGSGLAGLSLAYRLAKDSRYHKRRLLVIDKMHKTKNDRTWSFWNREAGLFDHLATHEWSSISYAADSFSKDFTIAPYSYKMIRGIDFYQYTLKALRACTHIEIDLVTEEILEVEDQKDKVVVSTKHHNYDAPYLLKSYPDRFPTTASNFVWQHFKGWVIETETPSFDPNKAMFMDFRVDQADETRFFYVLPTSRTRALVELAIFSKKIPERSFYDPYLRAYIKDKLQLQQYGILEEEVGAIPMTTFDFQSSRTKRVVPIGTNGGSVKASSGYAFTRIQKNIDMVHEALIEDRLDRYLYKKNRYSFYDSIMMNAILTGKVSGADLFSRLFSRLSPQTIFKFLDEEGSFFNDLKVFTAPPTLPFIRAFFEELGR